MVRSCVSPCSTLTRWSSYCTCKTVEDSRAPTVAALTKSLTCPLCSTTACGSTGRKLQRSRSCCPLLWWPMSLLCRSCGAAFCGYGRPVNMQRQVSLQQWRCLDSFIAEFLDIPVVQQRRARLSGVLVMTAMSGFFGAFCAIFRAPPVIPELSASFSSPRR